VGSGGPVDTWLLLLTRAEWLERQAAR
jgi:hypothetical protein